MCCVLANESVFAKIKIMSYPLTECGTAIISGKSSDLVTAADLSNFIMSGYEAQRPSDDKTSTSTFDHVVW